MPQHGGARSRSGPPPDPTALRRDRKDDQASWRDLTPYTGPVPAWPLPGDIGPAEVDEWARLWRTPQATVWAEEHTEVDVALYVRAFILASLPGAKVDQLKLVRMLRDDLGLSPGSALRKRWRIADDATEIPSAATAPTRPARTRPSARDRFRVIPATAAAEED
jgi:hypothetical protein